MAQTVSLILSAEERSQLAGVIGDRNRPQKHVQRARIVVHSAARLPVLDVARRSSVSRPAVWRWQQRYAEQGIDGLLRDKTRKPGREPLPPETVAKVLALPCSEAPGTATHWTGRAVAKAVGVSLRAVQRIWEAHRLQPPNPERRHCPADIIGEHMQAHLRAHRLQALAQEVGFPHPGLDGRERMLSGLAPDRHGVAHRRHAPGKPAEDGFMFPAPDATLLSGGAPFSCSAALDQLAQIEEAATRFADIPASRVTIAAFEE